MTFSVIIFHFSHHFSLGQHRYFLLDEHIYPNEYVHDLTLQHIEFCVSSKVPYVSYAVTIHSPFHVKDIQTGEDQYLCMSHWRRQNQYSRISVNSIQSLHSFAIKNFLYLSFFIVVKTPILSWWPTLTNLLVSITHSILKSFDEAARLFYIYTILQHSLYMKCCRLFVRHRKQNHPILTKFLFPIHTLKKPKNWVLETLQNDKYSYCFFYVHECFILSGFDFFQSFAYV